jgi:hypothetical protein
VRIGAIGTGFPVKHYISEWREFTTGSIEMVGYMGENMLNKEENDLGFEFRICED